MKYKLYYVDENKTEYFDTNQPDQIKVWSPEYREFLDKLIDKKIIVTKVIE